MQHGLFDLAVSSSLVESREAVTVIVHSVVSVDIRELFDQLE